MGRNQIIEYYDDFTGEVATDVQPIQFGFKRIWYEIDLNPKHAEQLQAAIQPFIDKARPLRIPFDDRTRPKRKYRHKSHKPANPGNGALPKETLIAIRAYVMQQHGVQLADRGKMAAHWVELWRQGGSPSLDQIQQHHT